MPTFGKRKVPLKIKGVLKIHLLSPKRSLMMKWVAARKALRPAENSNGH
jgi:hypothetical protein